EARVNLTIAQALITKTHTHDRKYDKLTVVLDTGASNHMFNDKCFFSKLRTASNMPISTGCNKSTLSATATGTVKLLDKNGTMWTLKGCLYVPDLTANLVALSQFAEEIKIKRLGTNSEVYLNKETRPEFVCDAVGGILETKIAMPKEERCLNTMKLNWHDR
ncbi:hypothetical protein O181_095362, partial [Austropuccinia psidii MF-1]|nr:hypothetical protein [Austropuccinia psidii MF-1]